MNNFFDGPKIKSVLPANESFRRTSLHLSLSAKSSFYLPALTVGIFKGTLWVAASLVGVWRGSGGIMMRLQVKYQFSKCFHRSKQEHKKYFSRHWRCQKIFKTIGAYTESTDKIFKAFKKLFISWHYTFKHADVLVEGVGPEGMYF
jgi:hypothetical protein